MPLTHVKRAAKGSAIFKSPLITEMGSVLMRGVTSLKDWCCGDACCRYGKLGIESQQGVDSLRYCNWHGCQEESMIGVITMLADRAAVGLQPGRKLGKDGRERRGEKNKLKFMTCDMLGLNSL